MNYTLISKSKRSINFVIDNILIVIITTLIVFILPNNNKKTKQTIVLILVYFVYYILFEGFSGQTVGKYFTFSHVIFLKKKNRWFWIIIRTILRLNPFDTFSFLFGTDCGTHDQLSFTRVVEED